MSDAAPSKKQDSSTEKPVQEKSHRINAVQGNESPRNQKIKSENVGKKPNANENESRPLISLDDNNDLQENKAQYIESSLENAIDTSSNENVKEVPTLKEEKRKTVADPVHINTPEKVERLETILKNIVMENQEFLPKDIPEYENIFNGPWILDQMPPYLDSSIPKGPTPPSPIEFKQKLSGDEKEPFTYGNWNVERASVIPDNPVEEIAEPWILKN